METAIVERTFACDEVPNVTVSASESAAVKVVINIVHPAGKKTTVIMGRSGEQEMAGSGVTVSPDSTGFSVAGKESDYMLSGAVDEDEFSSMLYWINKHPALVEVLGQKAHELGAAFDSILTDEPAATDQEGAAAMEMHQG